MQTAPPIALMGEAGSSRARELLGVVSHIRKPPTDNKAEGARKEEETGAIHESNVATRCRHVKRLLLGRASLRPHRAWRPRWWSGAVPAPTTSL